VARKLQRSTRNADRASGQAARTFFAGAVEITPDKQGRVRGPATLREYAHLDREVDRLGQLRSHRDLGRGDVRRTRCRPVSHRSSKAKGINDFL